MHSELGHWDFSETTSVRFVSSGNSHCVLWGLVSIAMALIKQAGTALGQEAEKIIKILKLSWEHSPG